MVVAVTELLRVGRERLEIVVVMLIVVCRCLVLACTEGPCSFLNLGRSITRHFDHWNCV
jgi:hypothetical protein